MKLPAVVCLVAAAFASAAASAPIDVRTIVLDIHHSRFSAPSLDVERSEKVRFVVRNNDPIDHELIVGPMAVQRRHESGRERHHGTVSGEISVPLFTTRSTTYTFDGPDAYWFGCHLPGHWAYGMKGTIAVG